MCGKLRFALRERILYVRVPQQRFGAKTIREIRFRVG